MTFEGSSKGEFAKTVSNHVFGNIYFYKSTTIVNGKAMTDKIGRDLASPSIGFNYLATFVFSKFFNYVLVNIRTFFRRSCAAFSAALSEK